jgi:hypothetical protein
MYLFHFYALNIFKLYSGNFAALLSYGIISNETDYYEELGRWVCKFSKTSQMSDEDMKAIIYIYDNLVCCFQVNRIFNIFLHLIDTLIIF